MPRYRKKPVVIEAVQMTREKRQDNYDWPQWLHEAWNMDHDDPGSVYPSMWPESNGDDKLKINTLEGSHIVNWGDYIVRGVQDELYPCKPDIFEQTYEPVEETWEVTEANAEEIVRRLRAHGFSAWHNTETECVEYADNLADFQDGRITRIPYGNSLTLQLRE